MTSSLLLFFLNDTKQVGGSVGKNRLDQNQGQVNKKSETNPQPGCKSILSTVGQKTWLLKPGCKSTSST